MNYNCPLTLLTEEWFACDGKPLLDENGNHTPTVSARTILCRKQSASSKEMHEAGTTRLRPGAVLLVHGFEYDGQMHVLFEGETYRVYRTRGMHDEELALYIRKVLGGGVKKQPNSNRQRAVEQ